MTNPNVPPPVAAQIAAMQHQFFAAARENAFLAAQVKFHQELARHKDEYTQRMVEKNEEVAALTAQLQLAMERSEMSQQLAAAKVENAQLKAAIATAKGRPEDAHQRALSATLGKAKLDNARLMAKIAELEEQLETLRVRLAEQPTKRRTQ